MLEKRTGVDPKKEIQSISSIIPSCFPAFESETIQEIYSTCEDDHIETIDCFCANCPHFDELNSTCWSFYGRFGEAVESDDFVCDFGFQQHFDPKTTIIR